MLNILIGKSGRRHLNKNVRPTQNLPLRVEPLGEKNAPLREKRKSALRKETNLSENVQLPKNINRIDVIQPTVEVQMKPPGSAKEDFISYLIEALAHKTVESSQLKQTVEYLEKKIQIEKQKNACMAFVLGKIRDGENITQLDKFLVIDEVDE